MNLHHERGLDNECWVITKFCQKGAELLKHRWRTPFGELDLLFRVRGELWCVEVKTLGHEVFLGHRLKPQQKQALRAIHGFVQDRFEQEAQLKVAYVKPDKKIFLFDFSG